MAITATATPLHAQEATPTPDPAASVRALGIYVTTQDFSSLREGPGLAFDRIKVLDPVTTLPAIGRSPDTRWIQVEYEPGKYGWIAALLLVWNGNIASLPLDGINPAPFARKVGVLAVTTRETAIYVNGVDPANQVGTLPAGTTVEVTGRLGEAAFMQFQINYGGEVYWVGSWDLRIRDPNWRKVFDTSYLYPYGRLVGTIEGEINSGLSVLRQIESTWETLDSGQPVSCNVIPRQLSLDRVTEGDLRSEPVFVPVADALRTAIDSTNAAILAFEDACGRPPGEFFITQEEVQEAFEDIETAKRNFNLAQSLILSLGKRDPLVNTDGAGVESF
jgi:hypothetical protein